MPGAATPISSLISQLLDPADYDALDLRLIGRLAERAALRRVVSHRGDLVMLGEGEIEFWYDAGSSGLETTPGVSFFPYRRRPGTVLTQNVVTCRTYASGDGSIFWIGRDNIVYRSAGYQATRISTHAEEAVIRTAYDPVNNLNGAYACASAFFYIEDGHSFYVLNFPDRTLVYDSVTQVWHDDQRPAGTLAAPGAGVPIPWRSRRISCSAIMTAAIFTLAFSSWSAESGNPPLTRLMTMPPLWGGTSRAFLFGAWKIEMEAQPGWRCHPAMVGRWRLYLDRRSPCPTGRSRCRSAPPADFHDAAGQFPRQRMFQIIRTQRRARPFTPWTPDIARGSELMPDAPPAHIDPPTNEAVAAVGRGGLTPQPGPLIISERCPTRWRGYSEDDHGLGRRGGDGGAAVTPVRATRLRRGRGSGDARTEPRGGSLGSRPGTAALSWHTPTPR